MFLRPEERYEQLQTYICAQTSVVAESQILLYRERLLLDEVAEDTPGESPIQSINYLFAHTCVSHIHNT